MIDSAVNGVKCDICGSANFRKAYEIDDGVHIIMCGTCGLWMSYPLLSGDEIDQLYGKYHEKWGVVGEDEGMHRRMRFATFNMLLKKISRIKNPLNGSFLDIGCATGICMEAAERYGWDVYGIDISETAISAARKKFGSKAMVSNFEGPYSQHLNSYDLIVMTDVLEHLRHVRQAVEKVYGMLKADGVIAIVTVNTGSLYARLMGKNWVHLCRAHTLYFSKFNLTMLLRSVGFNILRFERSLKSVNLWYVQKFMQQTMGASRRPSKLFLIANYIIEHLPDAVKKINFVIPTGDITIMAQKG